MIVYYLQICTCLDVGVGSLSLQAYSLLRLCCAYVSHLQSIYSLFLVWPDYLCNQHGCIHPSSDHCCWPEAIERVVCIGAHMPPGNYNAARVAVRWLSSWLSLHRTLSSRKCQAGKARLLHMSYCFPRREKSKYAFAT